MAHPLLECEATALPPDRYVGLAGAAFATFGAQDSGNISYGVQIGAERFFVKTAGIPEDPRPFLSHAARVDLLRNAARLHAGFRHPVLPPLLHVIESPAGPLLVYPWADGELLRVPRAEREDRESVLQRFRSLPPAAICRCLEAVFDLHVQLAAAGWIASDFYDGCLIYDFASGRLAVIDLDTYQPGPFQNTMGRMFGSTRFMAPEEFELGALIDQRTTVFTMGRAALVLLSDGTPDPAAFRGSPAQLAVARRATQADRSRRFDSVAHFWDAWQAAA